jgi:hypothetical protein
MNKTEIRTFAERYFHAFQSQFIENNPAYFAVELPPEVDKDLGNRPFYWTYVEKLGMEPNKLTFTFVFDRENTPSDIRGEELLYGSRRLHQIFDSAKKHGKYVRLYEEVIEGQRMNPLGSAPLVPWLGVNYKIEFICDQKRELLLPLGINLISGAMVDNFYERLQATALTPKLPDYSFTMQPIFGIDAAADRLELYIQQRIDQEDTEWAQQAWTRLGEEKKIVESYYDQESHRQGSTNNHTDTPEDKQKEITQEKETRLKELQWQHEPRIQVSPLNIGLFYLRTPIV